MAGLDGKYQFKVVLLGEGCVGKTSLVLRYCQDKFNDKHLTTLQVSLLDPSMLCSIITFYELLNFGNKILFHTLFRNTYLFRH